MRKDKKPRPPALSGKPSTIAPIQDSLIQATTLIDKGRYQQAIQLLDPLRAEYPRSADLHALLGEACAQAGQLWDAVGHYERALSLRDDADLLAALGFLYLSLDLNVLALRTFRQALKAGLEATLASKLLQAIQMLEDEITGAAVRFGRSPDKGVQGFRFFEEGQIALHQGDYARSIHLNRKATRLLVDFPAPHNNLSLALFFHGKPVAAIRTARQVVDRYPDNIQALSNLVRFLAWTGDLEGARQVWEQLKPLTPHDVTTRFKMAEAAAILEADEDVYRLLIVWDEAEGEDRGQSLMATLHLAIAEANTGRRNATRRLKALQETIPWAEQILEALQAGKRGLGWTEHFPYFHSTEMLPRPKLKAFFELLMRKGKMPEARFRREVARYSAKFPQLVLFGKKTLLEDQQVETAIGLLMTLGTPEAYAVLREFALGQIGDDESRRKALFALSEAGQIAEDEAVRFWQEGVWQEIKVKKYEITPGRELVYAPEVIDLLDQGIQAFKAGRLAEAKKLYQRVLRLEPRAKEALNNLATIYARQGDHAQAQAMYRKAIELDPLYVMPRCNLAMYMLDNDQLEEAQATIDPLVDVQQLHPQEMAFLSYVRARIHLEQREFDQARAMLELALQVYPDYEAAQELLERLSVIEEFGRGWERFREQQQRRERAKRERMRKQLTTPDPTLAEALGIYTKDILTAIARRTIPRGGWSAYRKAELHQLIVDTLLAEGSLGRVLETLTPEVRAAFEAVRANGGTMDWDQFAQQFGDDLDDSPHWQYHKPQTVMGRLRAHGLLVEVTVEGRLLVSIPAELRKQPKGSQPAPTSST